MFPKRIKLSGQKELCILWDDFSEDKILLKDLRKLCPCATCLAEREKQNKRYIPILFENQVTIQSINQVGNYAIQITWNDGHNSGIYEYVFLKRLLQGVHS